MRAKFIILMIMLTMMSACSLFGRDRSGYEDSDSIGDLSVPPELNLPERDSNYDIPEAPESEEITEEVVEEVMDKGKEEAEAVVDELVDTAVEKSE